MPEKEHKESPGRMLLLVIVLVTTAATLAYQSWFSTRTVQELVSPSYQQLTRSDYAKWACVDEVLHRLVPSGRSIFIANPSGEPAQRLAELLTPRDTLVGSSAEAELVVTAVDEPSAPQRCQGASARVSQGGAR